VIASAFSAAFVPKYVFVEVSDPSSLRACSQSCEAAATDPAR
jgi:hypothetical protein